MSGTAPPPERGEDAAFLDVLVAQALDDLEEGRLDLATTLRTLARAAWQAGRRYQSNPSGWPGATDPPSQD